MAVNHKKKVPCKILLAKISNLADPDLLATDPPENAIKSKMLKAQNLSATLLIIGFCDYRENYIINWQKKKETNFHTLTDIQKPDFDIIILLLGTFPALATFQYFIH